MLYLCQNKSNIYFFLATVILLAILGCGNVEPSSKSISKNKIGINMLDKIKIGMSFNEIKAIIPGDYRLEEALWDFEGDLTKDQKNKLDFYMSKLNNQKVYLLLNYYQKLIKIEPFK